MSKRNYSLDLLKLMAAWFVVMVHHFQRTPFMDMPQTTETAFLLTTFISLLQTCVPLFFITSGYLLATRDINQRHYRRLLDFLMESTLLLVVAYFLNHTYNDLPMGEKDLLKFVLNPPYYVSFHIGLYLLAPYLNRLLGNLKKQEEQGLLLLITGLVAIPAFLKAFEIEYFHTFIRSAYPLVYYFLGGYLRRYPLKWKQSTKLAVIVGALGLNTGVVFWLAEGGVYDPFIGTYDNLLIIIVTAMIFSFFQTLEIGKNPVTHVASFLAHYTLAYYIIGDYYSDIIARNIDFLRVSRNVRTAFIQTPFAGLTSMAVTTLIAIPTVWLTQQLTGYLHKGLDKVFGESRLVN